MIETNKMSIFSDAYMPIKHNEIKRNTTIIINEKSTLVKDKYIAI